MTDPLEVRGVAMGLRDVGHEAAATLIEQAAFDIDDLRDAVADLSDTLFAVEAGNWPEGEPFTALTHHTDVIEAVASDYCNTEKADD
jgi:hypothetical protein